MKFFSRAASLPLGIDVTSESVSIVVPRAGADGFSIRETRSREVPRVDAGQLGLTLAQTIRSILESLETQERRCILAAPSQDVVTRTFRLPPGMGRRESERAATLEAGTIVDWPATERVVALDPIPGTPDEMLLSIARKSTVERLVAIARAGGLKPIALDVPACAWRRAVPDADAVLDCQTDRAELVIFGAPLGTTQLFPPRFVDDRLASQVRTAFVDARRNGIADVQRLAILGTQYRYESLEPLLHDDGYRTGPVVLGGVNSPPWTFAFGLATWSIAHVGLAVA
jgi:Type IV pilus assembly protein PilM